MMVEIRMCHGWNRLAAETRLTIDEVNALEFWKIVQDSVNKFLLQHGGVQDGKEFVVASEEKIEVK